MLIMITQLTVIHTRELCFRFDVATEKPRTFPRPTLPPLESEVQSESENESSIDVHFYGNQEHSLL